MSTIKEEVLKLPREEKIDLLHTLQEDLQWDDGLLEEDELSKEQWAEIKRREEMIERGEAKWIGTEEFDTFLKERRNAIQGNKS